MISFQELLDKYNDLLLKYQEAVETGDEVLIAARDAVESADHGEPDIDELAYIIDGMELGEPE